MNINELEANELDIHTVLAVLSLTLQDIESLQ